MRINIAVHGRFYDFEVAAALLELGHDVELLTNYPRSVVARWFPAEHTRSYVLHGALSRVAGRIAGGEPPQPVEAALKTMFGRWAARHNVRRMPDVVHCWSGVAEESLRACRRQTFCTVARGSSHIRAQFELLHEEQARVGRLMDKPSDWIIAREEREYALAHRVIVGSEFARRSFIDQGHPPANVAVMRPPTVAPRFIAPREKIEERIARLRSGAPLRVLYTGLLSYRKGMQDMRTVLRALGGQMEFRFVGTVLPECAEFAREAARVARVEAAVPETALPEVYAWGDVFVLPTIEDGFAVVLAQAQAAGLPILTTTNCGGPDILADRGQGWVVPIRSPEAIIERLEWCNAHREQVVEMVRQLHEHPSERDWSDSARDFLEAVTA